MTPMRISPQLKGFLALLACAVLFGIFGVFVRTLNHDFTAYQQIAFRNVIGAAIAASLVLFTRQSFASIKKIPTKFVLAYMVSFPITVVLYTLAVLSTKIVTAIFALYMGGLLGSLLLGIVFFKEKVTNFKVASLLLVTIGFIVYAYPFEGGILSLGFLLGFLSGAMDAVANSFRKYLAGKVDRMVLVVLQMIGGIAVASSFLVLTQQLTIPSISPLSWIVGVIFGFSIVAISYLTLIGFQNFDLNLGTVVLSSEIFFASLFSLLFFGEQALPNELLGGVLIILATVVANLSIEKESWWHHQWRRVTSSLKLPI